MKKEKIGIEKLIELLNEYYNGGIVYKDRCDKPGLFLVDGFAVGIETMFGKRAGFIQRLVENDKIDLDKLDKKLLKIGIHKNVGFYEGLLMLLAIQDEPIRFLCEILK